MKVPDITVIHTQKLLWTDGLKIKGWPMIYMQIWGRGGKVGNFCFQRKSNRDWIYHTT